MSDPCGHLKPIAFAAALLLCAASGRAAVERVDIVERVPFAAGMKFGDAGEYEKIRGIAHFALDPAN